MNVFAKVKQYPTQLFLIGLSFLFFLLRLPSFVEPYWYGDEGIYEVIGTALRHKRALYTGIWDNKPPLLYYIYSLFNGDQESVRVFSCIVGISALIVFFILAKKILITHRAAFVATAFFALLFATPILEGNIANAENFMLLPAIVAGLFIWNLSQKKETFATWKPFFLSGLFLGISLLIKIVAVFDIAAFSVFFFIATYTSFSHMKKQILPLIGLFGGFLFPLALVLLSSALTHSLSTFIRSAFTSNVGYVGYGNYLLFPQGLLVLKLLLLAGGVMWLFWKREKFSKSHLFILLWLGFSLFSALFSQRPYTHYLLVLLPAFSLYLGLLTIKQKGQKLIAIGVIAVLFIIFFLADFRPQMGKKLVGYYGNYLSFTYGTKSLDDYLAFFDRNSVRDYKFAEFINSHKNATSRLFIWGNNGQLYKLTNTLPPGRYIVAYHIGASQQTWNETARALIKQPPTFIVVTSPLETIPMSLQGYKIRLTINNGFLYEKTF